MSALLGRRQERGGAKGLDSKSDVSHTEMFMRVRGGLVNQLQNQFTYRVGNRNPEQNECLLMASDPDESL